VVPDALVGLAGPYDVAALADAAMPLFGVYPEEDPAIWSEGNPMTWVAERPTVAVFVGHGEADQVVPLSFSLTFAVALERAGHPVHVERVPGADHDTIYHPDIVEGPLSTWIRSLS
jgi:acetyl esterase/lipase